MIPSWILGIFAAVMLVVAAVSAGRLVAARPWQRGPRQAALADIDVAHLLMAIAMAGMLVSGLRTLPDGAWEAVFSVMTVWFGYRVLLDAQVNGVRALAGGHCAPHLIHAGAMLYMFMAVSASSAHGSGGMSGMGGISGMGSLELPFLAFLFALALVGYSIWDLDQLSGPGPSGHYSLAVARVAPTRPVLAAAGAMPGPVPPRSPPQSAPPRPMLPQPVLLRPVLPRPRCQPESPRCRRPAPRWTAPASSPRGSRPAAGSPWASPWRSCW